MNDTIKFIRLGTKFQLILKILIFWTKFAQNGYFRSKESKHHQIFKYSKYPNIQISLGTKFQPKPIFCFFGPKLRNKGLFDRMWTLRIRIILSTKFQQKLTILIFWTKYTQKSYFCSITEKSKHHHWIVHIQISLGTEFQLKLTIMIFWDKFSQKGYFQSKIKKIALLRASVVVTYYIRLFCTAIKKHNNILISLIFLVFINWIGFIAIERYHNGRNFISIIFCKLSFVFFIKFLRNMIEQCTKSYLHRLIKILQFFIRRGFQKYLT